MTNKSLEEKVEFLNQLGTDKIISSIHEQELKLEQLLKEDTTFRNQNIRFLAQYSEDCAEVKSLIAELTLNPPAGPEGKKATVAQLEAWIRQQRDRHQPLLEAIQHQNRVTFQVENNRIEIDMTKKRLESLKGLLALRTAQIEFLK